MSGYATGVTLRQLYYRLVAAQLIPNTQNAYTSLSRNTARARREGRFPRLIDLGRQVDRPLVRRPKRCSRMAESLLSP
jgi:hypothetical protein